MPEPPAKKQKTTRMGVIDDVKVPEACVPTPPAYFLAADAASLLPAEAFTNSADHLEQVEAVREKLYHRKEEVCRECKLAVLEMLTGKTYLANGRLQQVLSGPSIADILQPLEDTTDKQEAYFHGGASGLAESVVMAVALQSFFARYRQRVARPNSLTSTCHFN